MATMAVARSASGLNDVADHDIADHELDTQAGAQPELSTRTEIDVVARALCAVSMHTSLSEALMSFYDSLDPAQARERSSLVLDRMRKILPHDLADNLQQTGNYARPWDGDSDEKASGNRSLLSRVALPAVFLIGITMLALSAIGSIATIHYFLGR
jgi:hypothetical protein